MRYIISETTRLLMGGVDVAIRKAASPLVVAKVCWRTEIAVSETEIHKWPVTRRMSNIVRNLNQVS